MAKAPGNTPGNVSSNVGPTPTAWRLALDATADGVTVRLKVVPGASRSRVMGLLGDRLKLAVAAPPEDGKANGEVCQLLAEIFAVARQNVQLIAGSRQPRKAVELRGLTLCAAVERLERHTASR